MRTILLEMLQKTFAPQVYVEEVGKEVPAPLNLGRLRRGQVEGSSTVDVCPECSDCPPNVA